MRRVALRLAGVALAATAGVWACSDSSGPGSGNGPHLTVHLTDAAGDVQAAVVTISEIDLQGPDSQVTLSTTPITTDLVSLADSTTVLVDAAAVPAADYSELRFVITGGYVQVDDGNGGSEIYASSSDYSGLPAGAVVDRPAPDAQPRHLRPQGHLRQSVGPFDQRRRRSAGRLRRVAELRPSGRQLGDVGHASGREGSHLHRGRNGRRDARPGLGRDAALDRRHGGDPGRLPRRSRWRDGPLHRSDGDGVYQASSGSSCRGPTRSISRGRRVSPSERPRHCPSPSTWPPAPAPPRADPDLRAGYPLSAPRSTRTKGSSIPPGIGEPFVG